jgi:hypothetical protein
MRNWRHPSMSNGVPGARRSGVRLAIGLAIAVDFVSSAVAAGTLPIVPASAVAQGEFAAESGSAQVRQVANWVIASRDNHDLPYLIVDKVDARVFVFDARGHIQGAAAALLGMARGDRSVIGIGNRAMSAIRPEDRITPAGRFVVSLDRDSQGNEVLVIDYAASISLHPVVKGTPQERRAQRLQSPTSADNRISFGCINVPAVFYSTVVSPAFTHNKGIAYVLPESDQVNAVSGLFDPAIDRPASP